MAAKHGALSEMRPEAVGSVTPARSSRRLATAFASVVAAALLLLAPLGVGAQEQRPPDQKSTHAQPKKPLPSSSKKRAAGDKCGGKNQPACQPASPTRAAEATPPAAAAAELAPLSGEFFVSTIVGKSLVAETETRLQGALENFPSSVLFSLLTLNAEAKATTLVDRLEAITEDEMLVANDDMTEHFVDKVTKLHRNAQYPLVLFAVAERGTLLVMVAHLFERDAKGKATLKPLDRRVAPLSAVSNETVNDWANCIAVAIAKRFGIDNTTGIDCSTRPAAARAPGQAAPVAQQRAEAPRPPAAQQSAAAATQSAPTAPAPVPPRPTRSLLDDIPETPAKVATAPPSAPTPAQPPQLRVAPSSLPPAAPAPPPRPAVVATPDTAPVGPPIAPAPAAPSQVVTPRIAAVPATQPPPPQQPASPAISGVSPLPTSESALPPKASALPSTASPLPATVSPLPPAAVSAAASGDQRLALGQSAAGTGGGSILSEAEVVLAVYRRGLMLVPQDAERNILITSILGSFVDRAREGGQPAIECLQRKGRDRFGIVDALRRELGALGELEPKYILRNPPDFTVGEFIPSRIAGNRRRCGADDSVLRVQFVPDVTPDGKLAHVDLNKIRATIVGGSSGFRLANRLESFAIAYAYARDPDLFGQERGRPFHFWMDSGTYGVGLFRIIPRRGASMSFEVVDYSRPNIGDRGAVFWFPK